MADARSFRYLATFQDPKQAEEDFAAVSALHRAGLLDTYGAALITRDRSGEVWLSTRELTTERGALLGALLGALTGRLLHLSLPAGGLLGGLAGGVIGYLRTGLPSRELRAFAATLAPGEAAVVVVGQSWLGEELRCVQERATQILTRRRAEVREINRRWEEAAHRTST